MAFKLASLFVEISAKGGVSGTLDRIKGQLATVGAGFARLGGIASAALGAAGVAGLGVGIYKAVGAASDLNETLSKVGVVFGPGAEAVQKQAEEMARTFGLPKGELLDAAASIGLVGKAAGQSQAQAAAMANQMAKLAADASSFYNVPLDDALNTIKSALVGESEPIRKFGVLLSEDAVKAEALRLGLIKTGGALDEQSKVMARSSLIVKGMSDATGDLERTQDSTSNQFRKFTGTVGNLAAEFGASLLPAVNKVLTFVNELVTGMQAGFASVKPTLDSFVSAFVTGFDEARFVAENFGTYWTVVSLKFAEGVINIGEYLATIPENLGRIGSYIAGNWRELIADAIAAVGATFMNLGENIRNLASAIFKWISDPLSDFEFNWTPLLTGFEATAAQLPELVKPQLSSMQDLIDAELGTLPARAAAKATDAAKAGADAVKAATAPGGPADAAKAAGKAKEEEGRKSMGLAEYARSLRAGGAEDTGKKSVEQLVKLNHGVKELTEQMKKHPMQVAAWR